MERIWLGVAVCSERLKRDSEPVFCGSDKQKVHPLQIIFLALRVGLLRVVYVHVHFHPL